VAYGWIIDALSETWSSTEHILSGRSERDFDALTRCPGWSVRDVVNHLIGTELFLGGAPQPDVTGPWPRYVKNSLGLSNEAFVANRRHLGIEDVTCDFHDATTATLMRLGAMSADERAIDSWSLQGPRPLHQFQETRVLDSWIHLQDNRDALLEPADDHGTGEEIVVGVVGGGRRGDDRASIVEENRPQRASANVDTQVADLIAIRSHGCLRPGQKNVASCDSPLRSSPTLCGEEPRPLQGWKISRCRRSNECRHRYSYSMRKLIGNPGVGEVGVRRAVWPFLSLMTERSSAQMLWRTRRGARLVRRRGCEPASRRVERLSDEGYREGGVVADELAELRSHDGAVGERRIEGFVSQGSLH
jgi:uncharacterized protein (TIGR03083 family)